MWFVLLKWLHVLAAITAVGASLTYGLWIRRASRQPDALSFVLENIRFMDRHVANPCYVVLLGTGVVMAFMLPIPLTTPWLLTGLVLYSLAALLGIFVYAPLARQQRMILRAKGFDSEAYRAIARRSSLLGMLVTLDVLTIVFLMVVKPALWG